MSHYESDIIIIFDPIVKDDVVSLDKLLSNENYSVTSISTNSGRFQKIRSKVYSCDQQALIFVTSSHSSRSLIELVELELSEKFDHFIHLVKNRAPRESISETNRRRHYFTYINGNDTLKKAINKLIDETNLIEKNYLEKDKIIHYEDTLAVYSTPSFAGSYFEKWRAKIPTDIIHSFAELVAAPPSLILDAGCGPGHHSLYLGSLGFNVIGVDLSKEALKIAEDMKVPNTLFHHKNMLNTGFRSNYFDGIWSCASIVHTPKGLLKDLFKEFDRILVCGGVLALTLAIGERQHFDRFGRFFESFPSIKYIVNLLDQAGFGMINIENSFSWTSTQNHLISVNWVTFYVRKRISILSAREKRQGQTTYEGER